MRIFWERFSPYIFAAIAAALASRLDQTDFISTVNRLVEPVINVSAVTVGFLGAMLGMLMASQTNHIVRSIKTSAKYASLFSSYIRQSFELSFGLLAVSILMLLLESIRRHSLGSILAYLWVFLLVASFFAAHRITKMLWGIVRSELTASPRNDEPKP